VNGGQVKEISIIVSSEGFEDDGEIEEIIHNKLGPVFDVVRVGVKSVHHSISNEVSDGPSN
jgi:hypothetical protein